MTTQAFRTTPPEIHRVTSLNLPRLRTRTLDNGITLKIYSRVDAPIVYLSAISAGGSAEAGSTALAALTSAMQREGSLTFDANQIASVLDFNGAWLKNDVTAHHSRQTIFTLQSRLADVMPVFVDLVNNPTFPDHEFNVRRESLARNIEVSRENVSYIARCKADSIIMGPTHPLAAEDFPEQIRAITTDRLKDFHHQTHHSSGLTLLLSGNITEDIEDMVASAFSATTPAGDSMLFNVSPFKAQATDGIVTIRRDNASQSAVAMTLPAIPRTHPDYIPLHLAVYALGGYFGSRLMLNIREEKGLTYGIKASLIGMIDGAYVDIAAETDNAHVDRLIDEVRAELKLLASNPPCGDELTRLRQSATSAQAAVLDSPLTIIDHYSACLTQGIPDNYFNDKLRAINDLSPEMISDIASRYLNPDNLRIVVAGNPL